MMRYFLIITLLLSSLISNECIPSKGVGEAMVYQKDKARAKQEALARAKWDAIDKALGIETSIKTLTENFALLDEVVRQDVQGFIEEVEVTDSIDYEETIQVAISGCVYPKSAEKALSLLSSDARFSTFILFEKEGKRTLDPLSPLTLGVDQFLAEQGFDVIPFVASGNLKTSTLDEMIRDERFDALESVLQKRLANVAIVMRTAFKEHIKKGADIGYGMTSKFHIMDAQGDVSVIAQHEGGLRVLDTYHLKAKGRALNTKDAYHRAEKNLLKKLKEELANTIDHYLKLKEKRILVEIEGVRGPEGNMEIKEAISHLAWVKSIEDLGIGRFRVTFQENALYLANGLDHADALEVESFSNIRIKARYLH